MVVFEDTDDVREWLADLSYEEFWSEVAPYHLTMIGDRTHTDGLISSGSVAEDAVLKTLKNLAMHDLRIRHDLPPRIYLPQAYHSTKSVH